jgi:cell filamentation protein
MVGRYAVDGSEGEYEPGSGEQVLRNLVGIASPTDMDDLELELLNQLYQDVLIDQLPDRTITTDDLMTWHRRWLGNVYAWAGQVRQVTMSKDGFPFAAVPQIPRLLTAIAVTHVEFILIHPFREGNGRLSRLLADVMAVQAGHDPLDYRGWDARKPAYVGAIHAGFNGNYQPMRDFVAEALGASPKGVSVPG